MDELAKPEIRNTGNYDEIRCLHRDKPYKGSRMRTCIVAPLLDFSSFIVYLVKIGIV